VSSSLRDQLLKAGLVTQKQVKQAEQHTRQPQRPKSERAQPTQQDLAAQKARAEKAARDQALSKKQQAKAERAARAAQVKQIVEQNRLPPVETEERYNFIHYNKIRSVAATAEMRVKLGSGELGIARCDGRYEVISAETAARVRERDPTAVIQHSPSDSKPAEDDPYKDHVVPDDLIW